MRIKGLYIVILEILKVMGFLFYGITHTLFNVKKRLLCLFLFIHDVFVIRRQLLKAFVVHKRLSIFGLF
jgi:hypothetical protein